VKESANKTGPLGTPEAASVSDTLRVAARLRLHWPEYLMEAGEMSLYMFCACSFATLLQHPASLEPKFKTTLKKALPIWVSDPLSSELPGL
jgi:hypothetical protein